MSERESLSLLAPSSQSLGWSYTQKALFDSSCCAGAYPQKLPSSVRQESYFASGESFFPLELPAGRHLGVEARFL